MCLVDDCPSLIASAVYTPAAFIGTNVTMSFMLRIPYKLTIVPNPMHRAGTFRGIVQEHARARKSSL